MNYLITGGCGFIGRNLCTTLRRNETPIKIIDLNPLTDDQDVTQLDVCYRLPFVYGDTIVHLAADTSIRTSFSRPRDTIIRNCTGLLNCLELLQKDNFNKLIFTSSASSEFSKSPYLASKKACEAICKSYSESFGLNIKVLKLSSVYGPHSMHKSSVIATFIKYCLKAIPLKIFGDGNQTRDFIYVDDVVKAILNGYEGYVSSGVSTSINCLVEMISEISDKLIGYKPRVVYEQPIQGEVVNTALHCEFSADTELYNGLLATFKWYVANWSKYNYGSEQLV